MTVCKIIEDDAGIGLGVAGDWIKPWEVKHGQTQTPGLSNITNSLTAMPSCGASRQHAAVRYARYSVLF